MMKVGYLAKAPEVIVTVFIAPRCLKRWYAVSTKHALPGVGWCDYWQFGRAGGIREELSWRGNHEQSLAPSGRIWFEDVILDKSPHDLTPLNRALVAAGFINLLELGTRGCCSGVRLEAYFVTLAAPDNRSSVARRIFSQCLEARVAGFYHQALV